MHVGKYELLRKIATGGMAEVFLARAAGPKGFQKILVVKRILPHLAEEPAFVDMFLSEAKLAAQFSHPNIVQIFDFGEVEGTSYIAMEFVDGPNLRTLQVRALEAGVPLPLPVCAKIIALACEGLAYAHDFVEPSTGQPLGVIHRDISPDNLLVARNGYVKVVDFGIAKASVQSHKTKTGTIKGKFGYMAPEQLQNQTLDRRTDVFALGMVLYEMVTGTKPFDGSSEASTLKGILFEPFIPAVSRRADIPRDLGAIVDKALAKEREQRYPDCLTLQRELERFIAGTGQPAGTLQVAELVASLVPPSPGVDLQGTPQPLVLATPQPAQSPRLDSQAAALAFEATAAKHGALEDGLESFAATAAKVPVPAAVTPEDGKEAFAPTVAKPRVTPEPALTPGAVASDVRPMPAPVPPVVSNKNEVTAKIEPSPGGRRNRGMLMGVGVAGVAAAILGLGFSFLRPKLSRETSAETSTTAPYASERLLPAAEPEAPSALSEGPADTPKPLTEAPSKPPPEPPPEPSTEPRIQEDAPPGRTTPRELRRQLRLERASRNGGQGQEAAEPAVAREPSPAGEGKKTGDASVDAKESYDALVKRATTLLNKDKRAAEAESVFRQALSLDPLRPEAMVGVGFASLNQTGKEAQAVTYFRKALKVDARRNTALFGLGRALAKQGNKDEAAVALENFLKLYPKDRNAPAASEILESLNE